MAHQEEVHNLIVEHFKSPVESCFIKMDDHRLIDLRGRSILVELFSIEWKHSPSDDLCFFFISHLFRMEVYHLFGWLWMMNFVIALGQCVLAGAFASWYFAFHKPDVSYVF